MVCFCRSSHSKPCHQQQYTLRCWTVCSTCTCVRYCCNYWLIKQNISFSVRSIRRLNVYKLWASLCPFTNAHDVFLFIFYQRMSYSSVYLSWDYWSRNIRIHGFLMLLLMNMGVYLFISLKICEVVTSVPIPLVHIFIPPWTSKMIVTCWLLSPPLLF